MGQPLKKPTSDHPQTLPGVLATRGGLSPKAAMAFDCGNGYPLPSREQIDGGIE